MNKNPLFTALLLFISVTAGAQEAPVDSIRFFTDEGLIQVNLSTDLRQVQTETRQGVFQQASISMLFPDSTLINETISVSARGNFRRNYCRIPPMMMNFRNKGAPRLQSLGKLKLVIGCGLNPVDEELLLKEYLVYKIYNILEDRSFRVRLMRINYTDTRKKLKPFSQFAFLIEDDGDMARRNGCHKKDEVKMMTEATNRDMMTMVALFQYMIGNTDWAVPANHNIKLIFDKKNKNAPPYVVPYDFDYCGLVDASYAIPHETIGTEKVTERVYRGFPRTMEELQIQLDVFRSKKDSIFKTIDSFELLSSKTRKEMTSYLQEFFELIENKRAVSMAFIDEARVN